MKLKRQYKIVLTTAIFLAALFITRNINAHCEVPCGIYNDSVRVTLILEHISTIEKSMNQINTISAEEKPNYNQLVRWVMNKEEHAEKIQEIVSQYFLHQRIKITDHEKKEEYAKYQKQLELLHKLSVYSMKTKQTTDLKIIDDLRATVKEFQEVYFHEHKHKH
ncbi:MAG: hypothetical protein JEY94_01350 [Melioribacteraceae bacterium]|nr:hypothetical protein [Melioribacteraceae bacterium]